MSDLDALRTKIAMMREMGVLECDGIKLGPPPAPERAEETKDEMHARIEKAQRRERDIMFAASSTRPKLVKA